jgi:hypothetical protein
MMKAIKLHCFETTNFSPLVNPSYENNVLHLVFVKEIHLKQHEISLKVNSPVC